MHWVNMSAVGYWQIKLNDLAVGGKPLNLGCACDGCCQAVVDSGSSVMMGPAFIVNLLRQKLNVSEECTNQTFPTLGFSVRTRDGQDVTLTMEPDDYMDRSGNDCSFSLMSLDVPPPKGPLFIFGDPFLRRFVTIYDRGSNGGKARVGFAVAKHNGVDHQKAELIIQKTHNGAQALEVSAPQSSSPVSLSLDSGMMTGEQQSSDSSSSSSDAAPTVPPPPAAEIKPWRPDSEPAAAPKLDSSSSVPSTAFANPFDKIGRASCRERV